VSTPQRIRIGMLGGSFDPPHLAHHDLAKVAIKTLGLNALHVVPTGQAWHKTRQLSDAQHRLAMTRIAFADLPGVVIDDCEITRGGDSYTSDTLDALQARYAAPGKPIAPRESDPELVLVVGWDQLTRFTTWHQWQNIARRVVLAVAYRCDAADSADATDALPDLAPWQHLGLNVVLLPMRPVSISSTYVRDHVSDAPPLDAWREQVSPEVAHYILEHNLYQT
jgi:nicotinate-nucleotide adenylyltransferase